MGEKVTRSYVVRMTLQHVARRALTCAAESLLAEAAEQERKAEIAVGSLAEVLQPPQVGAVLFDVLESEQASGYCISSANCLGSLEQRLTGLQASGTVVHTPLASLTVSNPRSTSNGIVVRPPRFHSSSDTLPSES